MSPEIAENAAGRNIIDAYIKALKNYFNFKGRTSRYDYWGFSLTNLLVMIFLFFLSAYLRKTSETSAQNMLYVFNIYNLLILIPSLSVAVRRFHDTGKSVLKWVLLPLVFCYLYMMWIENISVADKTFWEIVGFLAFVLWLITWFVFLCRRGSPADNKYGPAIMEDSSQRWKGLCIPIFMLVLPFLLALSMGFISGYSRAMNRYKTDKIVPIIYSLLAEAKGVNGGQPIVESDFSRHDGAQMTGMFFTDPLGGRIDIKLKDGIYVITRPDISFSLCSAFSNYNWAEHPDFIDVTVNDGTDCRSCSIEKPCTMIWRYK